jgi:hypothetical protein
MSVASIVLTDVFQTDGSDGAGSVGPIDAHFEAVFLADTGFVESLVLRIVEYDFQKTIPLAKKLTQW